MEDLVLAQEIQTQETLIEQLCDENMKLLEKNRQYRSKEVESFMQTKNTFFEMPREVLKDAPLVKTFDIQQISNVRFISLNYRNIFN